MARDSGWHGAPARDALTAMDDGSPWIRIRDAQHHSPAETETRPSRRQAAALSVPICGSVAIFPIILVCRNSLADYLRDPALEINSFRRQLTTFLFADYWTERIECVRDIVSYIFIFKRSF